MRIIDHPMNCCSIVQAEDFIPSHANGYSEFNNQDATRFKLLDEHQKKHRRNCALIALSNKQTNSIRNAEANGFKKILEFYNPNGNMVGIYAKLLWNSKEEYDEQVANGTYKKPEERAHWVFTQKPKEYRVDFDGAAELIEPEEAT